MTHRKLPALALVFVLLSSFFSAQAQTTPAKKELIAKLLVVQQPGIEALARNLAEQPAAQIMQAASNVLATRVPADKREALGAAVQADVKKYVDDAVPVVRERAIKLAPTTIGPVLEEKLTEDEIKQVIAILESPAFAKYQNLQGEMQNALTVKLVAETRPLIEPKIKALDLSIARRLGLADASGNPISPAATPAPQPGAARAPAKPASK
ncbi:MAG: hypothetical protein H7346_26290 [Burkholderiaceae bacterium]|nr:hypothetical protein [Burkholderiaceae bacterium]